VDIGIRLTMFMSPESEDTMSPQMEDMVREFFVGAVRLAVFGDRNQVSRSLRERGLEPQSCQDVTNFVISNTDLVNRQLLEEWHQISEESGGYFMGGYVTTRPFNAFRVGVILDNKNFGYDSDPRYKKGQENLAEDIACVFEKILSSLYKVIYRNNQPETVINDLLNKTPGEIGLYKKYRIACESLINWYQDGLKRQILTGFIQAINAAIKNAEENTDGQST